MTAPFASRVILFIALLVPLGWGAVAAIALPSLLLDQAKPQPPRPPDPPELIELRTRENEALDRLDTVVRGYLWPGSDAERTRVEAALKDPAFTNVSRKRFLDFEELMRRGRTDYPPIASDGATIPLQEFTVSVPAGPDVPVLVHLPPGYTPQKAWPLIWAMHGGPPSSPAQVRSSAERMIKVWSEPAAAAGWIVAAPGMTPSVTAGPRTENRLPYEVFHPEQVEVILRTLRARYNINPDRMVSTGISLGSNYSLQFAAARPGWFSAIVPVSTEGESRELVLRNLKDTPVYVLEGSRDRNIWGIDGPRALADILTALNYDVTYREFPERAHEGFEDHYADVLRVLDLQPRITYPKQILRVPHSAIIPVERRVRWIESDTRQGVFRATVTGATRIEVEARWTRALTLHLHDRLVDLDKPLDIYVNGLKAFSGVVPRSLVTALDDARALGDERRVAAARVTVKVTGGLDRGRALWSSLTPVYPEKTLSYWERFAIAALAERLPTAGFEGTEVDLPAGVAAGPEQVAMRVSRVADGTPVARAGLKTGDLLLEVNAEPFFRDPGGVEGLRQWLMRELRGEPQELRLLVWRDGRTQTLTGRIGLGPYAASSPAAP
jgi:enterochelin esterase-like enzyme